MSAADVPRIAALAVVTLDDRVLLVRRRHEPDADMWGFPGGHVNLGETIAECAIRELREETGIHATEGPLLTNIDVIREDARNGTRFHFVLVAVKCDYVSGEPVAADDVVEARWIELADIVAEALPMSRQVETVARLATGTSRLECGLLDID